MAGNMEVIWVGGEAKNFFEWYWTGQIRLNCFNKFDFARKRWGLDFAALQRQQRTGCVLISRA
jgi:hypothetical protein